VASQLLDGRAQSSLFRLRRVRDLCLGQITSFELDGMWRRWDVTLSQRRHDSGTVPSLLRAAGIGPALAYDASADLGRQGPLAAGRQSFETTESAVSELSRGAAKDPA
jgi:hypothetical protein